METERTNTAPSKRHCRRAAVARTILGGMLVSGLAVLPLAVMNSSHRDSVLNAQLNKHGLTVSSESGSGSWVTPVVINNVVVSDAEGRVRLTVREIRTSRTVLGLLANNGDLGTITFVTPVLQIFLDENGKLPEGLFASRDLSNDEDNESESASAEKSKPDVTIEVLDAELIVSGPWRELPVVQLQDIDILASITNQPDGRWLDVSPVQIFDHAAISEAHTEQNLALIAPVLSQTTALTGDVSVRLNGISVPLDAEPRQPILFSGEAVFHSVEARFREDWALKVSELLGRAAGTAVPDRMQIVRDSRVAFTVDERGVYHRGLAFLLPDLARDLSIQSSGTVGLDEQLDLTMSVQLPQPVPTSPLMAVFTKMTQFPLLLQVTGTVNEPKLTAPPGFSIVDQLSRNLSPQTHSLEPPTIPESVFNIVGSATSTNPEQSADGIVGGVLNIIRAASKAKENAPPREPKIKRPKKRDLRRKQI